MGNFGQIQLLWQGMTACPHALMKKEKKIVIIFGGRVKIFHVMAC
jgi:hypothetical protein